MAKILSRKNSLECIAKHDYIFYKVDLKNSLVLQKKYYYKTLFNHIVIDKKFSKRRKHGN